MECLGMPVNNCFQGIHLTIHGRAASVSPESQQSPTTEPHNRIPQKKLDLLNPQQERGIDSGAAEKPTPSDDTAYMKPQETWGRMPAKPLCGDFYQLPPVPATSSLLAPIKSPHSDKKHLGASKQRFKLVNKKVELQSPQQTQSVESVAASTTDEASSEKDATSIGKQIEELWSKYDPTRSIFREAEGSSRARTPSSCLK